MRAALLVLLACLVATALAKPSKKHFDARFAEYKGRFNKIYASEEEEKSRKELMRKQMDRIDEINEAHANNDLSWHADVTSKSDRSIEERRKMNGYVPINQSRVKRSLQLYYDSTNQVYFYNYTAGSNITVTQTFLNLTLAEGVLDQGQCGDCYSFAIGAVVSGYYYIYKNKTVIPSRQDVAACSISLGNYGCNGGDIRLALTYVLKDNVSSWTEYPYESATYVNGTLTACNKAERAPILYTIPSYTMINPDFLSMKYALLKCGPLAAAIFVNETTGSLFSYSGGVYDGTTVINGTKINECPTTAQPNHAITIVGFGTDASYGQYWIIKNSWGTGWGKLGYLNLKMGSCMSHTVVYAVCPNGIY